LVDFNPLDRVKKMLTSVVESTTKRISKEEKREQNQPEFITLAIKRRTEM